MQAAGYSQTAGVEFDAVVLAGGGSTRFGGVDKAMLVLEGVTLLDRVLTATAEAVSTGVVGPVRTTGRADVRHITRGRAAQLRPALAHERRCREPRQRTRQPRRLRPPRQLRA